ncbi:Uncharacterized protein FWK35_00024989 [Aphis craccivora]|uniref:Uncharacterized protein n=1 Tax=Aphis craccivora TaxID=307492 RepID=A0A6G0Y212_APHCR|nr:Uncharacterized protein FWK35_00024989 [Aphis craccivora]
MRITKPTSSTDLALRLTRGAACRSCEILKRFKEITVEISAEKTVSISLSVVFSRALKKFCVDISLKQYESEHLMKMVSVLKNQDEQRFVILEEVTIFSEITILDPSDFDSEVKNLIQSTNPTATIEVDKYLQEGLLARSENPLKW